MDINDVIRNNGFCFGNGLYNLEYDNEKYFRWMSDECNFTIIDINIKSISLILQKPFDHIDISINNINLITEVGINHIKIYDKNIKTVQTVFMPSRLDSNNKDNRKLSFKLYSVLIEYNDKTTKLISIKDIVYLDFTELNSPKVKFANFIHKSLNTPILEQNKTVKFLELPYDKNNFYFNSSIFEFKGEILLMARHSNIISKNRIENSLKLFELDNQYQIKNEKELEITDEISSEQYEDPRVLVYDNNIYVSCANYYQSVNEKYIHQKVLIFDDTFKHIGNIHPKYDGNGANALDNKNNQKNWTWFFYKDRLMCVYRMSPHIVVEFDYYGKPVAEYKSFFETDKVWSYGECRMGSNPILKDGYYHNFFHSSIDWRHPKKQYFMGYYKFESEPPFKIVEISEKPILWGNESDDRILPEFNPIVVFPCGSIIKDDKFVVSFGFNDEKTGIVEI